MDFKSYLMLQKVVINLWLIASQDIFSISKIDPIQKAVMSSNTVTDIEHVMSVNKLTSC